MNRMWKRICTHRCQVMLSGVWVIAIPSLALAMGAGGQGGSAQKGSDFGGLFMLVIIFAIFYFLLIRPQQKKAREHQQLWTSPSSCR